MIWELLALLFYIILLSFTDYVGIIHEHAFKGSFSPQRARRCETEKPSSGQLLSSTMRREVMMSEMIFSAVIIKSNKHVLINHFSVHSHVDAGKRSKGKTFDFLLKNRLIRRNIDNFPSSIIKYGPQTWNVWEFFLEDRAPFWHKSHFGCGRMFLSSWHGSRKGGFPSRYRLSCEFLQADHFSHQESFPCERGPKKGSNCAILVRLPFVWIFYFR